jgi:hypothetical protein
MKRTSDAIRHGLSPLPAAKNTKISPKKLRDGLSTLGNLWSKGVLPRELRGHFLLTWFAIERGRTMRLAKSTGFHRNTLTIQLTEYTWKLCYKLRTYWFGINKKFPSKPFPDQFFLFLKKTLPNTSLTLTDNRHLIDLWLMGFPERILRVHYILWAYKQGQTRQVLCNNLGISLRTLLRISSIYSKKGSPAYKWLGPMKITKQGFYPPKAKYNHQTF